MSKNSLAINWWGGICLLVGMLFAENTQAQTVWLDSLYVRVADAEVQRPSNGDAVVIFDIEVFRPVKEWNNNDTTLGSSDFVFGKKGMDLRNVFKDVRATSLHSEIGVGSALTLGCRFVLGKLQISLTKAGNSSRRLDLPYREWVKLCRVELPLKNPATVELGVVWDETSTGLITSKNIPILESLQDDLDKIPDKILTFEEYASSQSICSGEEFFLFAHAVSSGDGLSCTWHYSVDNGTTFVELNSNIHNWGNATGGTAFQFRVKGEHVDTLWLRGITANLSGIIFKCVAEDVTVTSEKHETPEMVLKVLPEVQVALEGYSSLSAFQSNLGVSGDTARHCPGEKAKVRVAFYGIKNTSQLNNLKGMGGSVHIAYRWMNKLGGDGRDTLSVKMTDIAVQSVSWQSGFVVTSEKLQLNLEEDGKYYIHKVWTDSCSLGTVLTAYDTVVVKQNSNVNYEFDPFDYVAGSGEVNVAEGLGINFTSIEVKSPETAVGSVLGFNYSAPADKVGTDTLVYYYNADGCSVTAIRRVNVVSSKHVAIKVLLEGPYIARADSMRCLYVDHFPKIGDKYISPYADKKECLNSFPKFDRGIVDWIYIEVWDYPPAGAVFGDSRKGVLVDSTSALLLSDGTVAGVDGNQYVSFDHLKDNDYYVLIRHRNHLPILSAKTVTFTAGTIGAVNTIDFTQKMENAFDNARPNTTQDPLNMVNGKCMMYAGELNNDGMIGGGDMKVFLLNRSASGYNIGDVSLDAQANGTDKKFIKDNRSVCRKF